MFSPIKVVASLAVVLFAASAGAVLAPASTLTPTMQHLQLTRSEPRTDSTVTAVPKDLKLWFSEPVHVEMTTVRLMAQDSSTVTLAKAAQAKTPSSPVVFAVKSAMKPGQYRVDWKTMGNDGHVVEGTFAFTLGAKGR